MNLTLRKARPEDAREILRIYTPYVLHAATSFETSMPSVEEMQARIAEYGRMGWLVAEDEEGRLAGYAYASKHRARAAYQWCCEVSVYVDDRHQRQGLARSLYERLFERLRAIGLLNAYAGVTLPNEKSVRFHESMGFKPIGVYEKIGYKLGRWHDVGWWALRLREPEDSPAPPQFEERIF